MGVLEIEGNQKLDLESKILELVDHAEMLLGWSGKLGSLYTEHKKLHEKTFLVSREERFLASHINLYFFDALSCIHTVLCKDKSVLSIERWRGKFAAEKSGEIVSIRENYEAQGFHKIRHRYVAHPCAKYSGDPATRLMYGVDNTLITKLLKIVRATREYCQSVFEDPVYNNYIKDFNEPVIKLIEDKLSEKAYS